MSDRPTFDHSTVTRVFDELRRLLDPSPAFGCPHALCDRLCAVGGYRRQKAKMKDIELLYIPRLRDEEDASDLFGATSQVNVTDRLWNELVDAGVLGKREKVDGSISAWGPENKHAVHLDSGLAIDLFAATAESWYNRLVMTTGPLASNIAIATAARTKGWEWEVAKPGFVPLGGTWETSPKSRRTMRSEREVFEFVGLHYLPPEARR